MREGQQERAQARTAGGSSERQLWESEADWDPGPASGARQARAGQTEGRLPRGGDLFDGLGLRPFGALGDRKLHLVALIERLEA